MHNNIIPHLKTFLEQLADYLKDPSLLAHQEKVVGAFDAFIRVLMDEYQKPENHTHPVQAADQKNQSLGRFYFILEEIYNQNVDQIFIKQVPFIDEILELRNIINSENMSDEDIEELGEIHFTLENMRHQATVLRPLLAMTSAADKLIDASTHQEMVAHLGDLVSHMNICILNVQINAEPYRRLDWRMLQILHRMTTLPEYQSFVEDLTPIRADFVAIVSFLRQLTRYMQSSKVQLSTLAVVDAPAMLKRTQVFQDREHARQMLFILKQLCSIKNEDSCSNRLAIVRGLYALGAASSLLSFSFAKSGTKFSWAFALASRNTTRAECDANNQLL